MKLHIFADNEIFEVVGFNGNIVTCLDKQGWGVEIPITRVEKFCNKEGNHITFKL